MNTENHIPAFANLSDLRCLFGTIEELAVLALEAKGKEQGALIWSIQKMSETAQRDIEKMEASDQKQPRQNLPGRDNIDRLVPSPIQSNPGPLSGAEILDAMLASLSSGEEARQELDKLLRGIERPVMPIAMAGAE